MKDGQDFNRWHFAGGYARRRGKEVEGLEVGRAGAGPGRHGWVWLDHGHVHRREWVEAPAVGCANTGVPLAGVGRALPSCAQGQCDSSWSGVGTKAPLCPEVAYICGP